MSRFVNYRFEDGVAVITMDDGKVNAMSPTMIAELDAALGEAEGDGGVVLIAGRDGVFSGGFDLKVLAAGGSDALAMIRKGFELAARILAFPRPVVMACPGHAVAMGLFLLTAGDYRIGAEGPYRLVANEVAIGMTVPRAAIAILRERLTPAVLSRAVTLAEPFTPADAVAAGLLDRVVPAGEVLDVAGTAAQALAALDMPAHAESKLRLRTPALDAIRDGIAVDEALLLAQATRRSGRSDS